MLLPIKLSVCYLRVGILLHRDHRSFHSYLLFDLFAKALINLILKKSDEHKKFDVKQY